MRKPATPTVLIGFVIVALVVSGCTPAADPRGDDGGSPNVLIILTDDQRLRGTLEVMPNTLRWFEDGGTKFSRAFATTPQCCPSRASIFTGQYAHNTGVLGNTRRWAERLNEDVTTQRYLDRRGYRTGLYGKFLNRWDPEREPEHFDDWALFPSGLGDYYGGGEWNVNGIVQTVNEYATDYIAEKGAAFIRSSERNDDRPWLLLLHPTAPHAPYIPAERDKGASVPAFTPTQAAWEKDVSDKHGSVERRRVTREAIRLKRKKQLRTLMSVDDLVERIFRVLQETDEGERTLAIFLSDNGDMWGEHGIGGKSTPYEDSIRIPLFVRWPGRVEEGHSVDDLVANIDIAPTILDAAGVPQGVIGRMDGRSLLDVLDGEGGRSRLLFEHWGVKRKGIPPWAAIRTNDHHYVEYYDAARKRVVSREYYDLRSDPWELDNLLADGNLENDPDVRSLSRLLGADRVCEAGGCP